MAHRVSDEINAFRMRCWNADMNDAEIARAEEKLTGVRVSRHSIKQWRDRRGLECKGRHGGAREGAGRKSNKHNRPQNRPKTPCLCDACASTMECSCHLCKEYSKCTRECRIIYLDRQLSKERATNNTTIGTNTTHKGGTPEWLKHKIAQRLLI